MYRSGDISGISIEDVNIFKGCNIDEIIDLHGVKEIELQGTTNFFPCTNIEISGQGEQNNISQINQDDLGYFILNIYHNNFVNSNGFSHYINHLINKKGNFILFHCTAGKDRTDVLGALLMYILDFDYDQIVNEYLKTDERLITNFEQEMRERGDEIKLNYNSSKPLETFINSVQSKYISMDAYLHKIGITDSDIAQLKEYYLE